MTATPLSQEQKKIYLHLALGILLLLAGGSFMIAGMIRGVQSMEPTLSAGMEAGKNSHYPHPEAAPVDAEPTYTLRFAADNWRIASANKRGQWDLPEFLPPDTLLPAPRSPMTAGRIAELFISTMKRNRYVLTREEFQNLSAINLDKEPLFADRDALAGLVKGNFSPPPEPEPAQKDIPNPVLGQERQRENAEETIPEQAIPSQIDPSKPAFVVAMRTWRDGVRETLQRAPGTNRGHIITIAREFGGEVELRVSGNARTRILSADFGNTKRDKRIYFQILLVQGGQDMLVDGMIGPTTRRLFGNWLSNRFANEQDLARYRALIENHIY